MNREIGAVYADALISLAEEHGKDAVHTLCEELQQCAALLSCYPDYGRLLSLPALGVEERVALAETAFGTEGLLPRLLRMLIERNRMAYLGAIADTFAAKLREYEKSVAVCVTSAVPLTSLQSERLADKLAQKLHKTVCLKIHIDPDLLGGVIVQYGDTRMDNSLRHELETLRARLRR